jgi:hypothetical protein
LGCDGDYLKLEPTKAIALGGGEISWVDIRQCILVCDVLDEDDSKPRLIPLLKLLPLNQRDKQRRISTATSRFAPTAPTHA